MFSILGSVPEWVSNKTSLFPEVNFSVDELYPFFALMKTRERRREKDGERGREKKSFLYKSLFLA